MPITLRQLCATEQFGLRVLAGQDQLDRTLTWAHVSELPDPTPFLDGGELLLITGVSLPMTAAGTTRFVRTLVGVGIAGIGFGTGLGYEEVPQALVDAATRFNVPLLDVEGSLPEPVPPVHICVLAADRRTVAIRLQPAAAKRVPAPGRGGTRRCALRPRDPTSAGLSPDAARIHAD
ncbi:PucR family transcriptional regulator ligand-binding domain-containing protein [Rhodococcus globerulus]|uniref:PucR family transcriptional regulator ligand-binding domain-containing protein n=1 Tax=Rhodococcus globerulus TaxID=33008 RepID=UPI0005262864|nr:PucR family transcriptional regulator ligand-binding domain-containing protein [Rhodococcus globerulus]